MPWEDKFKYKNRRKSERQEAAFTVTYGVKEPYSLRVRLGLADDVDAIMRDLSDAGMAMINDFELSVGALLVIKFNFINLFLTGQERSRQMELTCEVVSCLDLGKGSYRIGIRFVDISEEDKIAIRNFIKRSK